MNTEQKVIKYFLEEYLKGHTITITNKELASKYDVAEPTLVKIISNLIKDNKIKTISAWDKNAKKKVRYIKVISENINKEDLENYGK